MSSKTSEESKLIGARQVWDSGSSLRTTAPKKWVTKHVTKDTKIYQYHKDDAIWISTEDRPELGMASIDNPFTATLGTGGSATITLAAQFAAALGIEDEDMVLFFDVGGVLKIIAAA